MAIMVASAQLMGYQFVQHKQVIVDIRSEHPIIFSERAVLQYFSVVMFLVSKFSCSFLHFDFNALLLAIQTLLTQNAYLRLPGSIIQHKFFVSTSEGSANPCVAIDGLETDEYIKSSWQHKITEQRVISLLTKLNPLNMTPNIVSGNESCDSNCKCMLQFHQATK